MKLHIMNFYFDYTEIIQENMIVFIDFSKEIQFFVICAFAISHYMCLMIISSPLLANNIIDVITIIS